MSAPAFAAPGDPLVIDSDTTTFTAGSWGSGINFTLTLPEGVTEATVMVGSGGANGSGLIGDALEVIDEDADGTVEGTYVPPAESSPVAPDADGYPYYSLTANYTYVVDGTTEYVYADDIELTILDGASVTGPARVTAAQLESAEGVAPQFAGFLPDETLNGTIEIMSEANDWEYETIGDFSTTVGADGAGSGALWVTGAQVGDFIRVVAAGDASTVTYYAEVISADAPTTPEAPVAPTAPERIETAA
ncbi:hypothetical protein [Leucobacter denitrificans]|uniref:Uncharacterized protein n=1 Tax=Leucobacter denitrificans TaxID=683042 RepID=A0A7G9S765_9MICO|nr:hypothetical protein [Leucobacter denitrificans]QNN63690.1 hypothetical protein H9L06_05190 [Leucobacter denitrificans]